MIIPGKKHTDYRGTLTFNNDFDASQVKRIYTIENADVQMIRGWQGHKIEQRWFATMTGSFEIDVIEVDNFENPSSDLKPLKYILDTKGLNVLHVPAGYITAIKAIELDSKLLVMADYALGEVQDEYRFELSAFNCE